VYDNKICLSPALEEVLRRGAPADFDFPALSIFLRLGYFISEDTPFTHIRVLPPHSSLTWECGRARLVRTPINRGREIEQAISRRDAVKTYVRLFRQAIARRPPPDDKLFVPLSGGRDSRHILFELIHQGRYPAACVTVKYRPPATNEDTRIAKLIAEELAVRHKEVDRPTSWFEAVERDIRLTNYCGGGHAWMSPIASYLEHRATTIFDGIAGDVLSNGFLLDERKASLFAKGQLVTLAERILKESGSERPNETLLQRWFYERLPLPMAIERLVEELEKHATARNPLTSFIFWNRTRRAIASIPCSILSGVPLVYCPYLDHDLYDFLANLDATYFLSGTFHDEAIEIAYPRFAHIPYESKAAKATLTHEDHEYYRSAIAELWKHAARRPQRPIRLIRMRRLYSRMLFDLIWRRCGTPWYLTTGLYWMELESLLGQESPQGSLSVETHNN
jgi:hypothetical protein